MVDKKFHTVEKDDAGEFFISCCVGKHYLDGQLDFNDKDTLVGVYKYKPDHDC